MGSAKILMLKPTVLHNAGKDSTSPEIDDDWL
jgi:hypothetical protein